MKKSEQKIERVNRKSQTTSDKKRFSLLFISGHGKVKHIRGFKFFAVFTIMLLIVSIAATGCLYFFLASTMKENRRLKAAFTAIQEQSLALQEEKEVLLARLVIADSIAEDKPDKTEKVDNKNKDVKKEKKNPESYAKDNTEHELKYVDIQDVEFLSGPDTDDIKLKFKVINTAPGDWIVSGRIFVVFNNGKNAFILPNADIVDGLPSPVTKGRYFSIARFNIITLDIPEDTDLKKFKTLTVYVYSIKEKLLFKDEFPVVLD